MKTIRNWEAIFALCFYYLLLSTPYLHTVPGNEVFSSACEFYKKGNYEKALEQFISIEKTYPTVNLFYNIGNTYFRLGKIGLALVYYEKARKISPSDDDVIFNIKFLAGLINDPDYEQSIILRLDIYTAKFLFSVSLFIFTVIVSIKFIIPQKQMFWGIVLSFIFFSFFSTVYLIKNHLQNRQEAVVTNSAEIRSGPDISFKVNLTLPEGKKVIVLNKMDNWVEIGIKSLGIKGWLEEKHIEII